MSDKKRAICVNQNFYIYGQIEVKGRDIQLGKHIGIRDGLIYEQEDDALIIRIEEEFDIGKYIVPIDEFISQLAYAAIKNRKSLEAIKTSFSELHSNIDSI